MISGLLGIFSPVMWSLFQGILALYGALVTLTTVKISFNSGLKYLTVLPFAFIALHFGFGFGLITSWVQRLIAKTNGHADP